MIISSELIFENNVKWNQINFLSLRIKSNKNLLKANLFKHLDRKITIWLKIWIFIFYIILFKRHCCKNRKKSNVDFIIFEKNFRQCLQQILFGHSRLRYFNFSATIIYFYLIEIQLYKLCPNRLKKITHIL